MLIDLKLRDQAHRFLTVPGERLLYAGLRNRLDLPYECASGTCGSCRAKLTFGEIENLWPEAPGGKNLRGGEFLLCQSAARGGCSIEVRSPSQAPVPSVAPTAGRGVIECARLLAPDVLAFTVDVGRSLDFDAGQFVCLQFPQAEGFRSYSIVNFERGSRRLDFVVKRKPDGRLTPWLFRNDVEGCEIEWFGPLGRAIFQAGRPHDILCIAGGTGIAGIMSILRCAAGCGHFARSKGCVFFGVRTRADAFYLSELQTLVRATNSALSVTVALSEDEPDQDMLAEYPYLEFRHGLVHEVAGAVMAGRYQGVVAYLAGPKPAVDAATRMLLSSRFAVQNMRFDRFS